jgi:arabinofuranosyltransferase
MTQIKGSFASDCKSRIFTVTLSLTLMFIFMVFLVELVRSAWISDDAGITLRTVINFLNGYGPRFNIDERVQGYTHPLWFMLLSVVSYLIGNVYYSTFLLSIVCSLLTLGLVITKIPTQLSGGVVAGLILILSKSYLDFSTSGLENPLSHLLIVTIILLAVSLSTNYQARMFTFFCVSCGLLYLTRADLILLIGPLAMLMTGRGHTTGRSTTEFASEPQSRGAFGIVFKALLIGALPVFLWTFFSIYYYGFPFPNTAYAKLATGISSADRISQGGAYFFHFAQTDPLSCLTILIGVVLGIRRRNLFGLSISLGIVLYLCFVLSIGGDFMMGRFFTAPLLLATIQIARVTFSPTKMLIAVSVILTIGLVNINQTLLSGRGYSNAAITTTGIVDERGVYYQAQGLLTSDKDGIFSMRDWGMKARALEVTCGGLGFKSLYAGPSTHFIDTCALTDPLLARISSITPKQRIGHFVRALPAGYTESVANQKNLIEDSQIRNLYDSIRLITRGELNDTDRLKRILSLNINAFRNNSSAPSSGYRYPIALNETIYFKKNSKGSFFLQEGASQELLTNGWYGPEEWGVWSNGSLARLSLPIPILENPKNLYLETQMVLPPGYEQQKMEIFKVVGGSAAHGFFRFYQGSNELVKLIDVTAEKGSILGGARVTIPIDQVMIQEGNVSIEFKIPNPVRPKDNNLNNDTRELGVGLISATFR